MRCQITFSATRSPVPHFEHLYFDIGDYFGFGIWCLVLIWLLSLGYWFIQLTAER
jgi:hypothetical protein